MKQLVLINLMHDEQDCQNDSTASPRKVCKDLRLLLMPGVMAGKNSAEPVRCKPRPGSDLQPDWIIVQNVLQAECGTAEPFWHKHEPVQEGRKEVQSSLAAN